MNKPPYKVPSMGEIKGLKWNGYNVVSTFSGAGGSCLGYRMAGYRVLWANEFIPRAQEVYKLNHPDSILDTRDIRVIDPAEILDAIGLKKGDIDIFDGSPPCASFSTSGKREKGWGDEKQYSDTTQRVDDLFFEYARLLKGLQPKVFVAENVSGLVKGSAKGYFKLILKALKDCGYNVKAKLLDSQWLGVPQKRQRIIFVGVRNDLNIDPAYPDPLPYRYTVGDACPSIVRQGDNGGFGKGAMRPANKPSGTIGVSTQTGNGKFSPAVVEVERVSLEGYKVGQLWDETEVGKNHPKRFSLHKVSPDKPAPTIQQRMANPDGKCFYGGSATHPYEKRYLTIPEVKRIMAFPDDFQLTGTFGQQWERLGRAVPPVMMSYIASAIESKILCKIK